jgi:hypothetical protein
VGTILLNIYSMSLSSDLAASNGTLKTSGPGDTAALRLVTAFFMVSRTLLSMSSCPRVQRRGWGREEVCTYARTLICTNEFWKYCNRKRAPRYCCHVSVRTTGSWSDSTMLEINTWTKRGVVRERKTVYISRAESRSGNLLYLRTASVNNYGVCVDR